MPQKAKARRGNGLRRRLTQQQKKKMFHDEKIKAPRTQMLRVRVAVSD